MLTAVPEALQATSPAAVLDHILVQYIAQWLSAQCIQHAELPAHISQTDMYKGHQRPETSVPSRRKGFGRL